MLGHSSNSRRFLLNGNAARISPVHGKAEKTLDISALGNDTSRSRFLWASVRSRPGIETLYTRWFSALHQLAKVHGVPVCFHMQ
jgi:hypothetical protein